MKIILNSNFRIPNSERGIGKSQIANRKSERGMATFIFIILVAIMLALVMAESTALFHLRREVKMLEQKQIKRLDILQTNAVVAAKPELK